jgi:hypothetical protein
MKGKDKCEFLREIRKNMAEANGLSYEPHECNYEGDCSGTCPFCEKETADLLAALKEKERQGLEIKIKLMSLPQCTWRKERWISMMLMKHLHQK